MSQATQVVGESTTNAGELEAAYVTNHALHIADNWPLYPVSPIDASTGAAAHEHYLDGGANNVLAIYVIVGPTDLVTAGDTAKTGGPECAVLLPGTSAILRSVDAIQKLYMVGIATATNVGGNVIGYGEVDDPTIRGELIELDFNAVDQVKEVRLAASASGTGVLVNVGGRSDV